MTCTSTEPIVHNWTISDVAAANPTTDAALPLTRQASASDVCDAVARREPAEIPGALQPLLAAAASELSNAGGMAVTFDEHDPIVALIRAIAKVAARQPAASGPNSARLIEVLNAL